MCPTINPYLHSFRRNEVLRVIYRNLLATSRSPNIHETISLIGRISANRFVILWVVL